MHTLSNDLSLLPVIFSQTIISLSPSISIFLKWSLTSSSHLFPDNSQLCSFHFNLSRMISRCSQSSFPCVFRLGCNEIFSFSKYFVEEESCFWHLQSWVENRESGWNNCDFCDFAIVECLQTLADDSFESCFEPSDTLSPTHARTKPKRGQRANLPQSTSSGDIFTRSFTRPP